MKQKLRLWCGIAAALVLIGRSASAADAPPAPSQTASVVFKPYGFVRLDAIYDSAEMNHPQSPIFVDRQAPGVSPGGEFSLHPRLTRLGLQVSDKDIGGGVRAEAKIEVDFQNGGRESRELPRMRHAYVEWSRGPISLLFGQTWQTVSRLLPLANADTLMWGVGNTGDRSPQLRATYKLALAAHADLTFEAALQAIGTVSDAGQAGFNFGDVPAQEGRVALTAAWWTKAPLTLALGAHYGHQEITEKLVGKQVFPQKGVFGELSLPLFAGLTLRGEAFFGENLADLRGGIGQGINPIRDLAVRTRGAWAEALVEPVPALALALGAGRDDPNNADLELGQPSRNQAMWGVIHVKPWRGSRLGCEYLHWQTRFRLEQPRTAHRIDAHLQWEF